MKLVEKTNGYKTKGAALIYLIMILIGKKFPFVEQNEKEIMLAIDTAIATGIIHDIIRNRKKIISYIYENFKKLFINLKIKNQDNGR